MTDDVKMDGITVEAVRTATDEVRDLIDDHNNQLILVVDDIAKGRAVSETWMRERAR